MSMVILLLTGDSMHLGPLVGMNTEAPECVVLIFEYSGIEVMCEALLECFEGIDIEADEDVEMCPYHSNECLHTALRPYFLYDFTHSIGGNSPIYSSHSPLFLIYFC